MTSDRATVNCICVNELNPVQVDFAIAAWMIDDESRVHVQSELIAHLRLMNLIGCRSHDQQ